MALGRIKSQTDHEAVWNGIMPRICHLILLECCKITIPVLSILSVARKEMPKEKTSKSGPRKEGNLH